MFTFHFDIQLTHDQVIALTTAFIIVCIFLMWRYVLGPIWLPAFVRYIRAWYSGLGKNKKSTQSRRQTLDLSEGHVPGAITPQPEAIATPAPRAETALVPAAEDIHAEEPVVAPLDSSRREIVGPHGSVWIERLLIVPAHFCPATSEPFFAPVLYNPVTNAFMSHPTRKFYGTAACWLRIYRKTIDVPAHIDSDVESQRIQPVSGSKKPHLRICGAPYALDRYYEVSAVAAAE